MSDEANRRPLPMELVIAPDGMEATVELRGPLDPSLDADAIFEIINEHNIRFGMDSSAVYKAAAAYRTSGGAHQSVVVARGQPTVPPVDGVIEILVPPPPPVVIDPEGRADYRNLQRYRTVDKGEILARRTPAVPGKAGINILNERVDPPAPLDPELDTGPNVEFSAATNEYRARVHGIFVQTPTRIDVNPVLQISGHVGLETGNIDYDGSIKIAGNIERGASLSALGDVTVGGAVESGAVRVSGSLTVRAGINHRREGTIQVSGNLSAVYIDNSDVNVEGSVLVERSITTSRIICQGEIALRGPHSGLAGGEIYAYGSISADAIGSKAGVPTKIILGTHVKNTAYYEMHVKELEKAAHDYQKRAEDIRRIKVYVQSHRGPLPVDKQAAFRVKLREYKEAEELVKRLEGQVEHLRLTRFNPEPVRITARETIFPGVEIQYRGRIETITKPVVSQVLLFSPDAESVVYEVWRPGRPGRTTAPK